METGRDILVKDWNTEIVNLWIVTQAVRRDEIEMEQPIGGKKPKTTLCPYNQVFKVLKKKKNSVHKDAGLIPNFSQWLKDLALLQAAA